MVLGTVVLLGTLLATYVLWVRWTVLNVVVHEDRLETRQITRQGIGLALATLMADADPNVDWLGEQWAAGFDLEVEDGLTLKVSIEDEGSKLGVNWLDAVLWEGIPGMTRGGAERIVEYRSERNGFPTLGAVQTIPDGPNWDVSQLRDWATVYSQFNVNVSDQSVLELFSVGLEVEPYRARQIATDIVAYRADHALESVDELLEASTLLTIDTLDLARDWLTVQGPINVNTAPPEVLRTLFRTWGSDEAALGSIISRRRTDPIRSLSELSTVSGDGLGTGSIMPWLSVQSNIFRITSYVEGRGESTEAIVVRNWDERLSEWELEVVAWSEGG